MVGSIWFWILVPGSWCWRRLFEPLYSEKSQSALEATLKLAFVNPFCHWLYFKYIDIFCVDGLYPTFECTERYF